MYKFFVLVFFCIISIFVLYFFWFIGIVEEKFIFSELGLIHSEHTEPCEIQGDWLSFDENTFLDQVLLFTFTTCHC